MSIAKWLIVKWLLGGPATGYEIMKRYEEAFGRVSPGTIYPLLAQLERKGVIRKTADGKFELTDSGRQILGEIERKREEMVNEAKKRIHALADLLDDPYMRKWADYLPVLDKVSPRVLDVLADVELLSFELGERAVPVLERAKKELEAFKEEGMDELRDRDREAPEDSPRGSR